MEKKYCIIIDTYPRSQDEQDLLLENLKTLKSSGIDVLVTSHHPCTQEIIENSTYFLFEKKNEYHFLDGDILNFGLKNLGNPVYMKYLYIGNEIYRDRLVVTGWSVAVTSQMFNAIKFLYSKGYNYAFYLVSDFICPKNVASKIQKIIERSGNHRNYFIKNRPNFESWYAGFLFGVTIDETLISRIPNKDFSENSIYQDYFPNCAAEDVMMKVWGSDDNFVDDHSQLDNFFGEKKWDLTSSVISKGESSLHSHTSSSVYVNDLNSRFHLMLHVAEECPCDIVVFRICLLDEMGLEIFSTQIDLPKNHWYKQDLTELFTSNRKITLRKTIQDKDDPTLIVEDKIVIDPTNLKKYSLLKNLEII